MIPWRQLNTGEDVSAFAQRLFDNMNGRLEAAKGGDAAGVMSDPHAQSMIDRRVALYNEDPVATLGMLQAARRSCAVPRRRHGCGRHHREPSVARRVRPRAEVKNGFLDEWNGDAAAAQAELEQRLGVASSMVSAARSLSSAGGRIVRRSASRFIADRGGHRQPPQHGRGRAGGAAVADGGQPPTPLPAPASRPSGGSSGTASASTSSPASSGAG